MQECARLEGGLFPNKDITREPFYLESLNLTTQDFITTKLKHTCRRHTSNISPARLGAFLSKASAIDAVIRFHKGREGTLDGPFPTLSQCQQWFQAFSLQKMASANKSTGGYTLDPSQSADLLIPLTLWPKDNDDRLEIARLLLRDTGCDPNGASPRSGWDVWCWTPHGMRMAPLHFDVPLGDARMDGYGRVPGSVPHLKGVGDEGFRAWVEGIGEPVKAWLETEDGKKAAQHYGDPTAQRQPDAEDEIMALMESGHTSATGPGGKGGSR
ncbi:hypothetical protein QC762_507075 [Podospora pseudocomata]|uniref:Uncharacterized protein n=1 Tax=Podospora pseudocomata TaxID=2093779 RepID=A0ABR0GCB8_9PEZI|nr:hypothetical protein QC762_507075 [Podospora pseudocomata]